MKADNRTARTSHEIPKRPKKSRDKFVTDKPNIAPNDYLGVTHDLQVHQIELALQNEELRETQLKLEESRAQYVDLYDHALTGYFTFDGKGRILAVNLTSSRQLRLGKDALPKKPFSSFMCKDAQ